MANFSITLPLSEVRKSSTGSSTPSWESPESRAAYIDGTYATVTQTVKNAPEVLDFVLPSEGLPNVGAGASIVGIELRLARHYTKGDPSSDTQANDSFLGFRRSGSRISNILADTWGAPGQVGNVDVFGGPDDLLGIPEEELPYFITPEGDFRDEWEVRLAADSLNTTPTEENYLTYHVDGAEVTFYIEDGVEPPPQDGGGGDEEPDTETVDSVLSDDVSQGASFSATTHTTTLTDVSSQHDASTSDTFGPEIIVPASVNSDTALTDSVDSTSEASTGIVESSTLSDPSSSTVVDQEPSGGPSVPQDGLVLHLESTVGIVTDGNGITEWTDQSGNGNNLVAGGAPQLSYTSPNGSPVVKFDGSDDVLERVNTLNSIPTGNTPRTVIMLVSYLSNGYGGFAWGTPDINNTFGTIISNVGRYSVQAWGPNDRSSSVTALNTGFHVQSVTHDGERIHHYIDNSEIDQVIRTYETTDDRIVLGAEIDYDPYVAMEVAAVLVYDRALSGEELSTVQTHLEQTYIDESTGTPDDGSGEITSNASHIDVMTAEAVINQHLLSNASSEHQTNALATSDNQFAASQDAGSTLVSVSESHASTASEGVIGHDTGMVSHVESATTERVGVKQSGAHTATVGQDLIWSAIVEHNNTGNTHHLESTFFSASVALGSYITAIVTATAQSTETVDVEQTLTTTQELDTAYTDSSSAADIPGDRGDTPQAIVDSTEQKVIVDAIGEVSRAILEGSNAQEDWVELVEAYAKQRSGSTASDTLSVEYVIEQIMNANTQAASRFTKGMSEVQSLRSDYTQADVFDVLMVAAVTFSQITEAQDQHVADADLSTFMASYVVPTDKWVLHEELSTDVAKSMTTVIGATDIHTIAATLNKSIDGAVRAGARFSMYFVDDSKGYIVVGATRLLTVIGVDETTIRTPILNSDTNINNTITIDSINLRSR